MSSIMSITFSPWTLQRISRPISVPFQMMMAIWMPRRIYAFTRLGNISHFSSRLRCLYRLQPARKY